MIFFSKLFQYVLQFLRAGSRAEPVPNTFLQDRLDGRKVLFLNADGIQILQVFGRVRRYRVGV